MKRFYAFATAAIAVILIVRCGHSNSGASHPLAPVDTPRTLEKFSAPPKPSPSPTAEAKTVSGLSARWAKELRDLPRLSNLPPPPKDGIRTKEMRRAGPVLGALLDELQAKPAFRGEALEFLAQCAQDRDVYYGTRALCAYDVFRLDRERFDRLAIEDETRALALKLR